MENVPNLFQNFQGKTLIFHMSRQMLMEQNLLNTTASLIGTIRGKHFETQVKLNADAQNSKHSLKNTLNKY